MRQVERWAFIHSITRVQPVYIFKKAIKINEDTILQLALKGF